MARWVEITAQKQEADAKEAAKAEADKVAQVGPLSDKGGRGNKSGIRHAARELGVPRQTVQRAVKIAALSPEAKRLAKKMKAPQATRISNPVNSA